MDAFPELINYELSTPTSIFARLPLQMSLKTLTILASTNEALALELVCNVVRTLQDLRIGALVRNSSVVAELRTFLESIQAKYAFATPGTYLPFRLCVPSYLTPLPRVVWTQAVTALLHLALATASLEHILTLVGELHSLKTAGPVSLPVGALLNKFTLLANELHASFGQPMLADCWSNANCSRHFDSYNGTALSDREQTFERNTNWERGMGCAFTTMPLPKAPVQYYELLIMTIHGDGNSGEACMGIVQAPIPPVFIPLGGRPYGARPSYV